MTSSDKRLVRFYCAAAVLLLGVWIQLAWSQSKPTPPRSLHTLQPAPRMRPAERMLPAPLAPFVPNVEEAASTGTAGCIVLGNGKVYRGVIAELPDAYQIQTSTGVIVLSFAQVRTVAESLDQAYQQLRDSYERPSASDHIDLGRWCLQNQLVEDASTEAQAALVLEPNRKEAISLFKRAEEMLGRTAELPKDSGSIVRPRQAEAVGVVSAEAQLEFSRHIQRLALNKCGNGSCHGAGALSEFKLIKGSRSDKNLQAILKYIDPDHPELSPLLVKARSTDGPHSGLFQGTSGAEQYAKILAWVTQVSQEQGDLTRVRRPKEEPRKRGPFITIRPSSQSANPAQAARPHSERNAPVMNLESAPEIHPDGDIQTVSAENSDVENSTTTSEPIPKSPREAPLRSARIQQLLEEQAPDLFDPEEFNQMVHGDRPSQTE